jgi:ribose/xylose/arabinose/galactoside ABC-type transport system permease subunit
VLNFMNVSSFYQWIAEGVIIIAAVSFFAGKGKS